MKRFYLKKWYLDFITPDNIVMYIYVMIVRIGGFRQDCISALLFTPTNKKMEFREKQKFSDFGGTKIVSGLNFLHYGGDRTIININQKNASIALAYSPISGNWFPNETGKIIQEGGNFISWYVPITKALVNGNIVLRNDKIEINGTGYVDVVEISMAPWKIPIKELLWGRAHCGKYTVVYDQITLRNNKKIKFLILQRDGIVLKEKMVSDDTNKSNIISKDPNFRINLNSDKNETTLTHPYFDLKLKQNLLLEDSSVITNERLKNNYVRKLLGHFSGNPKEKKIVSDATLFFENSEYNGKAIHEQVLWHWK